MEIAGTIRNSLQLHHEWAETYPHWFRRRHSKTVWVLDDAGRELCTLYVPAERIKHGAQVHPCLRATATPDTFTDAYVDAHNTAVTMQTMEAVSALRQHVIRAMEQTVLRDLMASQGKHGRATAGGCTALTGLW